MIFIKGGKKKQRDLAENAACFAINKLFPKFRKYSILIRLNKFNDCFEYDDREFVINIDKKQNCDDFLTAIFHELVHVKQYLKNEMDNYSFRTFTDYYILPQEQEAYLVQEELLNLWDIEKKN
jgi:hypothetical protein|tara:strand:- start:604 stop:972 length:369 start_codon:yes stop_codon:yes gene_type:complete